MLYAGQAVVVVSVDGSFFQMSMYELGTIAVNKVPIKILVRETTILGLRPRASGEDSTRNIISVSSSTIIRNYAEIADCLRYRTTSTATANETLDAELDRFLALRQGPASGLQVDSQQQHKIRRRKMKGIFSVLVENKRRCSLPDIGLFAKRLQHRQSGRRRDGGAMTFQHDHRLHRRPAHRRSRLRNT